MHLLCNTCGWPKKLAFLKQRIKNVFLNIFPNLLAEEFKKNIEVLKPKYVIEFRAF